MLICIFVLAFLSYLIHGYTWIQYCEAYTKRAYILNGVVSFVSVEIQNELQALKSNVYWIGEATLLDYDDQFGLIQAFYNHNKAINSLVKFKSFFNLV